MTGVAATQYRFVPDDALKFRGPGQAPITEEAATSALSLARLTPYWCTNEWASADTLRFAVGLESIARGSGQVYTFAIEVDDNVAFSSAKTVVSGDLTDASAALPYLELAFAREVLAKTDVAATHVRVKATPVNGYETGTITISDWLAAGDQIDLEDGAAATDEIIIGTPEVGTIAYSSVAEDGDTVTIDDGVNDPVVFTYGPGTGGTVDKGLTATNSAQNLKTAIEAAVTAGDLYVSVSGASTTLTIINLGVLDGGSITKSDADNDYTVTDFSGGIEGVMVEAMYVVRDGDATYLDQVEDVRAAIEAAASGSFTATRVAGVITVVNDAASLGGDPEAPDGSITEDTDSGNAIAIVDFAAALASIGFWCYLRSA